MNGAQSVTGVAGALPLLPGHGHSPSSGYPQAQRGALHVRADGPLTTAKKALAKSLRGSGFIDPTASLQENFATYLAYRAAEAERGDLQPGALQNLVSWIRNKVAAEAERSVQAQAHIRPEAAVRLLT
jgi:hypothetical protein